MSLRRIVDEAFKSYMGFQSVEKSGAKPLSANYIPVLEKQMRDLGLTPNKAAVDKFSAYITDELAKLEKLKTDIVAQEKAHAKKIEKSGDKYYLYSLITLYRILFLATTALDLEGFMFEGYYDLQKGYCLDFVTDSQAFVDEYLATMKEGDKDDEHYVNFWTETNMLFEDCLELTYLPKAPGRDVTKESTRKEVSISVPEKFRGLTMAIQTEPTVSTTTRKKLDAELEAAKKSGDVKATISARTNIYKTNRAAREGNVPRLIALYSDASQAKGHQPVKADTGAANTDFFKDRKKTSTKKVKAVAESDTASKTPTTDKSPKKAKATAALTPYSALLLLMATQAKHGGSVLDDELLKYYHSAVDVQVRLQDAWCEYVKVSKDAINTKLEGIYLQVKVIFSDPLFTSEGRELALELIGEPGNLEAARKAYHVSLIRAAEEIDRDALNQIKTLVDEIQNLSPPTVKDPQRQQRMTMLFDKKIDAMRTANRFLYVVANRLAIALEFITKGHFANLFDTMGPMTVILFEEAAAKFRVDMKKLALSKPQLSEANTSLSPTQ